MTTGSPSVISDLYRINNIVQNQFLSYPKEIFIATIREAFSRDTYFHYVADEWGFPKVPSHLNLPLEAGVNDEITTRIYIGEAYRYDKIFYPAVLIKSGAWRYVPISLNQENTSVTYEQRNVIDGYGRLISTVNMPVAFVFAGAWEGNLTIDVLTKGINERDFITEFISLLFTNIRFFDLQTAGISIKPNLSVGSPSETDDYNDKVYRQTINVEIRYEWRREIPIDNLIDTIAICVEFGNLEVEPPDLAPNLSIQTFIDVMDEMSSLE